MVKFNFKLGLQELIIIDSEQVWLAFSSEDEQQAWPQEGQYSYEAAYWNAYLNRLGLNAFVTWIKEYLELTENLEVWPNQDELTKLWGLVNGTVIELGKTRIVLIPHEGVDIAEFCVQREWIDIPSWVADYYILIQINPDNCWLRVLGYTTHQILKQKGNYNKITRTYSLDREDLIADLNVMWMAREFSPDEKVTVEPLGKLLPEQVKNLVDKFHQPLCCSPRLDIDFKDWGALLADENFRQQLYNSLSLVDVKPSQELVNLRGWFQRNFELGWEVVEEILGTGGANLALAFRSSPVFRKHTHNNQVAINSVTEFLGSEYDEETRLKTAEFLIQVDIDNVEAIATLIELLNTSEDVWIRLKAAENLGRISLSNTEAINALTAVLHNSQDDDLRWQAALSLGRIDPMNRAASVNRGRLIDLGMEIAGHPVALIVDIRPESEEEVGIFLRLCPTGGDTYLPPNLELIVLDESGEIFDQAQARSADNRIQLKFSVELGDRFSVKVAIGDTSHREDFMA